MRNLLYIDSSYTLSQIRERDLVHVLKVRHLDGYWDRVWSVHPVDTQPGTVGDGDAFGKPVMERITEDHFFVRGRYGLSRHLARLAPFNVALALISVVIEMLELVRSEKIAVVRAGDPLLCGLLGLIVARITGAKLMVRINGNNDMIRKDTGQPVMPRLFRKVLVEEFVERLVLSRADSFLAPSQNYMNFAVSKGADPKRCHLVRYGNLIDPRHLAPVAGRPLIDEPELQRAISQRQYFLYIGRLLSLKHVEDCIEVLGILVRAGHDVGLCLVGDGSMRGALEVRAAELGVLDRVLFLGNRNQGFLSRLIPLCVGVLSPLTGRALTEAAFGEAAIVAYDLDWQGDLVIDGVSGLLVPAHDIEAMARGAARLLQDPNLARALGVGARNRAFELLEPQRQTELEIAAYEAMGVRG